MNEAAHSGNADRPIGDAGKPAREHAKQEIGVPGPGPGENPMSDAAPSGNANLPIGGLAQHQHPRERVDEEIGGGLDREGADANQEIQ